jgi:beta-galactosidase GanA
VTSTSRCNENPNRGPGPIVGVRLRTLKLCSLLSLLGLLAAPAIARAGDHPLPRLVQKEGRHALLVDGAPFLILGAQVNNSSAWPAVLPEVWPAIKAIHANTVEMPVYWEQFEPKPGAFDYSIVDALLAGCRKNDVRLVLLWFATWKNGSPNYVPLWMKQDPARFPRMTTVSGRPVASASPFSKESLEADKRAFVALMRHLKKTDPQRTVIMVQVENESGTWGAIRDYSPAAQKAFESPVPAPVLAAMSKKPGNPTAGWKEVFGKDADEYFHAWAVAAYVGEVAAAGKAEYPLPLYANAALRDPISPGPAGSYESGGPTDNVIPIWKAAAPALDLLAPDIYMDDYAKVEKILELYQRSDNPLLVPEISNAPEYARFFFLALGHQTVGFAPFGIDYTGFVNFPLGAKRLNEEALTPFALNYRLVGPMMRQLAQLSFDDKVKAVAEQKGRPTEDLELGGWKVNVRYGVPQFGFGDKPPGNPEPVGRALVAQIGADRFLVAGFHCRVDFQTSGAATPKQRAYLRVEEGTYENGKFKPLRLWNGDQTDWGLNFTSTPQVLRVTVGTY